MPVGREGGEVDRRRFVIDKLCDDMSGGRGEQDSVAIVACG